MTVDELIRDLEAYHCSRCEEGQGYAEKCVYFKNCVNSLYYYHNSALGLEYDSQERGTYHRPPLDFRGLIK